MKELEIEFLPPDQPVEVSEEEIAFELAKLLYYFTYD